MAMKYSPEQHLNIARETERLSNAEKDDERGANLKDAARRRRIVANPGWKRTAEKVNTETLDRLQKSASGR